MAAPTALEQLFLEYINEARLDPMGNAARYVSGYGATATSANTDINQALSFFKVSGPALLQALSALTPTNPLAWNEALSNAALAHNAAMIAADDQTHQAPGELDLGPRLQQAGYSFTTAGENVFAFSESPLFGHAGFMVDWGNGPDGMQSPAGHRISILNPGFRDVGVAVTLESNPATDVGPQVVTQDFGARSSSAPMVLGVAYADTDGDDFYSVGEGRGGLSVSAGGAGVTNYATGGYVLQTGSGNQTVTFTGAGLTAPVSVNLNLASGANVKIDIVGGTVLKTSASATISGPVGTLEVMGAVGRSLTAQGTEARRMFGDSGDDSVQGGQGSNYLRGASGNDVITGGAGFDDINGNMGNDTGNGGAGDDWVVGGKDNDVLFGGDGIDIVNGNLGADTGDGGAGNDIVLGGQGNDVVRGGDGDDYVSGDRGDDIMTGGLGADIFHGFVQMGVDRVTDFNRAEGDVVRLDAGTTYTMAQVAADTVLTIGAAGDQLVLQGVSMSSLTGAWIVFG